MTWSSIIPDPLGFTPLPTTINWISVTEAIEGRPDAHFLEMGRQDLRGLGGNILGMKGGPEPRVLGRTKSTCPTLGIIIKTAAALLGHLNDYVAGRLRFIHRVCPRVSHLLQTTYFALPLRAGLTVVVHGTQGRGCLDSLAA